MTKCEINNNFYFTFIHLIQPIASRENAVICGVLS